MFRIDSNRVWALGAPLLATLALGGLTGCPSDEPEQLTACTGDRIVTDDAQLAELAACTEVTGNLQIAGLDVTAIILPDLRSVAGELRIARNAELTELDLSALESIGGPLIIEDNTMLGSLGAMDALVTVDGDLRIARNDALASTAALSSLEVVGAGMWVRDNAALASLELPALEVVRFDLDVSGCPALTQLAVPRLQAIGNGLWIRNNAALASVDGLDALGSIGLDLIIWGNASLANLDGLIGLSVLGGDLRIEDNAALASIDGLANLATIGGNEVIVRGNAALPSCNAADFVAALPIGNGVTKEVVDNGAAADPAACDGPE